MKTRAVLLTVAVAPVLYEFYFLFSQRLNSELAVFLTAWLALVIPVLWFGCRREARSARARF